MSINSFIETQQNTRSASHVYSHDYCFWCCFGWEPPHPQATVGWSGVYTTDAWPTKPDSSMQLGHTVPGIKLRPLHMTGVNPGPGGIAFGYFSVGTG